MKNFIHLFALLSFILVGCQTDALSDAALGAGEANVLNVSLGQTRVSLGAKGSDGIYPLYWSEGDKIVVNGIQSAEAQIDAANKASAKFSF
ncbi:MAG: hypothetical protein II214_03280, partial [Alistipes sp.]|nr:hypothetical protein [Alistipes sp.]